MDLLEHVVPVAFLLCHHGIPEDPLRFALDLLVRPVEERYVFLIDDGVFTVFEIDDVPRVGEKRRDIGGNKVFVVAKTQDERRAVLRGDDCAGLVPVDHHERVVPVQLLECLLYRVDELRTILHVLFDEMGDDLGIGFGPELVSRFLQPLLQREEVLDDAVVNDDNFAAAVTVGVGVVLVRLAMRSPARMAHAKSAMERLVVQLGLEVGELPLGADDFDAAAVHDGDSRAVVASIFELLQSADQNRHDITRADVSDDSAHEASRTMNAER